MEPVLISALEHWSYCPRQCGLIHLEAVWDENVLTLRGRAAHERADTPVARQEKGRRVERALPIWSERYGLQGRADVVEFPAQGRAVPVEYKVGRATPHIHAHLQLCAQAFCLEEMFDLTVTEGALFFVASQRRERVEIDAPLRAATLETVEAVRAMQASGVLPIAQYDRRCRQCSLIDACLPQTMGRAGVLRRMDLFIPLEERDLP